MKMMRTLIATLCVIGAALAAESPVLLFGVSGPAKPALQTLTQEEFADIVTPLLKDHMIVAFQEEGLATEDLHSCARSKSDAQSCYAHLKQVQPKTFYPNVEDPAVVLARVAQKNEKNFVNKKGKLETPLKCETGKVVFVKFNDPQKNRIDALEAHDAAIASIVSELSCPVVYLYMSTPSNSPAVLKRARRDTSYTAAPSGGYIFRHEADFLLFFTTLSVKIGGTVTSLTIDSMTVQKTNSSYLSVTLNSNAKPVTFGVLYNTDDYYYMKELTYDGVKFRTTYVNAPPTFSYFCGNLTVAADDGSGNTLMWNSLQFQAPFGTTTNTSFVFGDSWQCVGFFTHAILAGLFVSIIMLYITFTGICWMMDINTMDRFDDPKGKTITINASE